MYFRLLLVTVPLLLGGSACTLNTTGMASNFDGDPILDGDAAPQASEDDSGTANGRDEQHGDGSLDAAPDGADPAQDAGWLFEDVATDGGESPTDWPSVDASSDLDAERRDADGPHPHK
jgi:hypothetical protein